MARGPKVAIPASLSASTMPSTSGSSGATTTKSIAFILGRSSQHGSISVALRWAHRWHLPQYRRCPAEHRSLPPWGSSLSARMTACSRPPEPTTRIFIRTSITPHNELVLVFEVTHAGEYHGNAGFITGFDAVLVPDGAARLNDGGDAAACGQPPHSQSEGEECIRSHDRTFGLVAGVFDGQIQSGYTVGLSRAHAHSGAVLCQRQWRWTWYALPPSRRTAAASSPLPVEHAW